LSAAGYRVMVAADAEEALALVSASGPIDLVLTDVVMPGMNGPELVACLRASLTDLRVLYMSGYDRELVDQEVLEGTAGLLSKPFTPRGLLTRIDELLRAPAGSHSPTPESS